MSEILHQIPQGAADFQVPAGAPLEQSEQSDLSSLGILRQVKKRLSLAEEKVYYALVGIPPIVDIVRQTSSENRNLPEMAYFVGGGVLGFIGGREMPTKKALLLNIPIIVGGVVLSSVVGENYPLVGAAGIAAGLDIGSLFPVPVHR